MHNSEPDTDTRRAGDGIAARVKSAVSAVIRAGLDLVVPPLCLACRKPLGSHDSLCASCWRQIRFIRQPLCDRLGIPLSYDTGTTTVSAAALADPPSWDRARAVAQFSTVMRDLIHGFKYADRHDARRLFGRWLTVAGQELLSDADMLVPVPLHRMRLLGRRFNQSAILAQDVARRVHVPVEPFVIERIKATRQQVGLSQSEREHNLAGAFRVRPRMRPRVEGGRIVLVDDVITTGSTAGACARVLRRAGAARVDVLALALVSDDADLQR